MLLAMLAVVLGMVSRGPGVRRGARVFVGESG